MWQIFLDMAVLVEAQGELLDNIETQVGCFTLLSWSFGHLAKGKGYYSRCFTEIATFKFDLLMRMIGKKVCSPKL